MKKNTMKKLLAVGCAGAMSLSLAACGDRTGYPEDGQAIGEIGDTMHTAFFDFTINSAELADSFDGYTPAEGYELLVADITIENIREEQQYRKERNKELRRRRYRQQEEENKEEENS